MGVKSLRRSYLDAALRPVTQRFTEYGPGLYIDQLLSVEYDAQVVSACSWACQPVGCEFWQNSADSVNKLTSNPHKYPPWDATKLLSCEETIV